MLTPFGSFTEEESGVFKYKEKNLEAKINFNNGTIKGKASKKVLSGIIINPIDVVVTFGYSAGTDNFMMQEKATNNGMFEKLEYKKEE